MRRARLWGAMAAGLLTTGMLAGCAAQESEPTGLDLAQSREQALERTQFTIDASGIPDGWVRGELMDWDPATAKFSPDWCSTGGGGGKSGRIQLTLNHPPLPDDEAEAAVGAVWKAWEDEGYELSWVVGPGDVDGDRVDLDMRADGPAGLVVSFAATEFLVQMIVTSDCSDHPDMDPTPPKLRI